MFSIFDLSTPIRFSFLQGFQCKCYCENEGQACCGWLEITSSGVSELFLNARINFVVGAPDKKLDGDNKHAITFQLSSLPNPPWCGIKS